MFNIFENSRVSVLARRSIRSTLRSKNKCFKLREDIRGILFIVSKPHRAVTLGWYELATFILVDLVSTKYLF